jgi:hypothetical protein
MERERLNKKKERVGGVKERERLNAKKERVRGTKKKRM